MKNLKLFIPLAIFLVLALLLLKGLDRDPGELPSVLIGKAVPDFSLPDLHQPEQRLDNQLFDGEVTLLNVWATWCVACRVEHPFLMTLKEQGVRIVSLNYKDNRPEALQWLVDRGNPYVASIEDAEGTLGLDLGVYGAPETYLVDRNGIIRDKHVGVVDERVWQQLGATYAALQAESH